MCQLTDTGSQIELMHQQGMPRKVGKSVELQLIKRQINLSNANKVNISEKNENNSKCPFTGKGNQKNINNKPSDTLAKLTQWTRHTFSLIAKISKKVQNSNAFKLLCRTTQPAHVIAISILSFVLIAVWPNLIETKDSNETINQKRSGIAFIAYLAAFATHFGSQIWMTFVSGLSLYLALPRHTFGLCQQILFPKYFSVNSIMSICTLIMFVKVIGGRWEFATYVQVIALTLCALIEVTVRLYLAPPLLLLMREKYKFEINAGTGQEIGFLEQKDLTKCPHYQKIHKAFRRIHTTVAMGNMTALVCTFLHLHYLASRIRVS